MRARTKAEGKAGIRRLGARMLLVRRLERDDEGKEVGEKKAECEVVDVRRLKTKSSAKGVGENEVGNRWPGTNILKDKEASNEETVARRLGGRRLAVRRLRTGNQECGGREARCLVRK